MNGVCAATGGASTTAATTAITATLGRVRLMEVLSSQIQAVGRRLPREPSYYRPHTPPGPRPPSYYDRGGEQRTYRCGLATEAADLASRCVKRPPAGLSKEGAT